MKKTESQIILWCENNSIQNSHGHDMVWNNGNGKTVISNTM